MLNEPRSCNAELDKPLMFQVTSVRFDSNSMGTKPGWPAHLYLAATGRLRVWCSDAAPLLEACPCKLASFCCSWAMSQLQTWSTAVVDPGS